MRRFLKISIEIFCLIITLIVFGVPLSYVVTNAGKTPVEAARANILPGSEHQYLQNFSDVLKAGSNMLSRAFFNSTVITLFSILLLLTIASMTGFVLERRKSRTVSMVGFLALAGLMIPPAIVPTIFVMKTMGVYKTLTGLILIEAAVAFPFAVLLIRGYMGAIPRELDEASFVDGCSGLRLFFSVIFPLLKPILTTITIISGITIFNDFVNPLYFLPGAKNVTVQLTLYNFISAYSTKWNLLFADILLISLPPLFFYIFFNKRIVSGMVAGAVKG